MVNAPGGFGARHGRAGRAVLCPALVALVALASTSACDPCAGVAGCTVEAHTGATGQLLDAKTGRPVAGAVMDFVRTGGAVLTRDSVRTVTDAEGLFAFDVEAAEDADSVEATIVVRPPDVPSFRVVRLQLPVTHRKGEVRVLGPWSTDPKFPEYADLYLRGAPRQELPGVLVEFRRTGGIQVSGLTNGVYRARTNAQSWVPLFGNKVQPIEVGDLIGDFTVFLPLPAGPSVRKDFVIHATATFAPELQLRILGAGPSLEYHIAVARRGVYNGALQGVPVHFQQDSGIVMTPSKWTSYTDGSGRVAFPVRASQSGTVYGTLTVTPPAPWKEITRTNLAFETFEDDAARLYAVVEVGPGMIGYLYLTDHGAPVKDAVVHFTRTGGLATDPKSFDAPSDSTGRVLLTTSTTEEGEVIGDVTVHRPDGSTAFTVRGLHIPAIEGDVPADTPPLATWDLSSPPAGAIRKQ